MPLHPILYEKKPYRLPRAGTPAGEAARNAFVAGVLGVMGDAPALWLPKTTSTTTVTDETLNARVFTEAATLAGRLTNQGSGIVASYNGTTDEADTPDTANLSFGDGSVDDPLSIIAWLNQTATTGIKAIFSKYDAAGTLREYQLVMDAAEKLRLRLYDESADTYIGRVSASALATGSVLFVAATYTGSGATGGITLYSAAAALADADESSGTYVAMENLATVGRVWSSGSATAVEFFSGGGLCVAAGRKVLTTAELWQLKTFGNSYFELSL